MTLDSVLLFIGQYTQHPTVYSGVALWITLYDSISLRCSCIPSVPSSGRWKACFLGAPCRDTNYNQHYRAVK